jgi:hypothetical protein
MGKRRIITPYDGLSRREVLKGAGTFAAGAAFAAAGGAALTGMAEAKGMGYPWPYKKIDPEKAAQIAYDNWYRNFCSYGAAAGIIMPLQKSVGGPWNGFPIMAVKFGEGGVEGWGTTCGTLIGGSVAISLAAGHDGKAMINDLMQWYSETQQPVFTPKKPRTRFKKKTVSNSPLCHVSVGTWMKAEGKSLKSAERKDRCARLTGSVAQQIAIMLNDWSDGKYKPAYTNKQSAIGITTQNNCTDCHGTDIPTPIKG